MSKLLAVFLPIAAIFAMNAVTRAQSQAAGGRVVLVLPFDNHSGNASLNWIGGSFPNTLNKRLDSAGFLTISRDDRAFAFDHMGLPVDFKPTRATTIRIAQVLDANFVIVGSFNVVDNKIAIQARVLSIDTLKMSLAIEDSAELPRLFDAENAVAWKVARVMDPKFSLSEQTFLGAPGAVPLPAFEDYIRGSNATNDAERLKRLQAAVALVPDYAVALLALGKEQYAERNFDAAAASLAKVPKTDRVALEANFYLGLSRFNSADYVGAQKAFGFVAKSLPLPEVVNDEGVALSRQNKDGADEFRRASAADPSDEDYHYNLAVALYRRGDRDGATREVDAALKLKPTDREALELQTQLKSATPGTRPDTSADGGFTPVERIRRTYSETGFRQVAFQLDQVRAARMAMLSPEKRVAEYTALGRQYLTEGLLPEAETQFQAALEAVPNSADAHAGMAQLREASGDAAKARDEAKTSLSLKPNVAALLVLARLDMTAKQLASSADDVSRALQIEPTNARAIALKLVLQERGQTVQ